MRGLSLLRNRSLAAVLVAELVSLTGSAMTYVALPWFVLVTSGSTERMGWVLAAEMLPVALFGIPSGSLIARLGAKRTMNLCDAARAPLLAVIPVLQWSGHLSFAVLLVIAFLIGCFLAPYFASSQLILPEVVGNDEQLVAQGASFVGAANQVTGIVGPVLAGVVIAWRGAPSVLLFDAATYLFSFVVIFGFVRAGGKVQSTPQSRGLLAGVRYVFRDRLLAPMAVCMAVLSVSFQGLVIALPVLAFRRYHHDPHIAGLLFSAFGVGALAGSVAAAHFTRTVALPKLASVAILIMGIPLWLLMIAMPWFAVMAVLMAVAFFAPLVNAPMIAMLTVRTPEALRPKVMTAIMTISSLAGPFGFVVLGEMLQYLSLATAFLIVAVIFSIAAIAFSLSVRRNATAPVSSPQAV